MTQAPTRFPVLVSHHPTGLSFPMDPGFISSSQRIRQEPPETPSLDLHPQEASVHLCSQESTHGNFLNKLIPSRWKQSAQLRREGGEAHNDRAYLAGV